ncbi:MAG: hypothetical protein ACREUM_11920 [Nitrosospira sp.]
MLAMWISVALWQIDRLDTALSRYRSAMSAALIRSSHQTQAHIQQPKETSSDGSEVITMAEYWQIGAERYFLLLALAQVRKCVVELENDKLPIVRHMKILRLLRDIDEHWEQIEGRSLLEMRKVDHELEPGTIQFSNKHVWLGDVSTGELATWLIKFDFEVRKRSAMSHSPIVEPEEILRMEDPDLQAASAIDSE